MRESSTLLSFLSEYGCISMIFFLLDRKLLDRCEVYWFLEISVSM